MSEYGENGPLFDPDLIRDSEREYRRLKTKVRKYLKDNMRDYLFDDSIVGRRGKKLIQVPITGIRLPHFERDRHRGGGIGQGAGEPGDALPGQGQPEGGPGENHVEHPIEVDVDIDEVLEVLQELLELPNIDEKGKRRIENVDVEYTDLRKVGPECLLDTKRTLKNSLMRIMCGADEVSSDCPDFEISPEDMVFKTWEEVVREETNAVVFAMMDISGSMGVEQKKIVATTMYWIEEWIKKQYHGSVEFVHLVHDTEAWEVTSDQFYKTSAGGGTTVSSVLTLCDEIIDKRFPASDWNIYPFFFSDGDNTSGDNDKVIPILRDRLLRKTNQICYGQVHSASGDLYKALLDGLGSEEKLCVYELKRQDDVLGAIKKFLGRGR